MLVKSCHVFVDDFQCENFVLLRELLQSASVTGVNNVSVRTEYKRESKPTYLLYRETSIRKQDAFEEIISKVTDSLGYEVEFRVD